MTEYKDTLNLPKTSFPMKANLAQREPGMLAAWKEKNIYQSIRQARTGKERFILHDGPPYANGHLHCGHALNKILKDIIVKSKTMSGYDSPFVPGWDCHGLPIELNVEKKVGKAGRKVSNEAFRQKCREYAASQIDIQKAEFQRLGVFADWQNPYTTMDYHYEADIVRALGIMMDKGYVKQGFKPVHWCVACGSALAEAEVDYEDKISPSIDVAFTALNPQAFFKRLQLTEQEAESVIVPIWTTTPWTLPANEAVCLNPEILYALVKTGNQYYLVANDLVESIMHRYGTDDYRIIGKLAGEAFEGLKLNHPFAEREVPLVLGEHVTTESGTGCVHTAPAHGPDDYLIGRKYQLPLINPVKSNGCYDETVAHLDGLPVLKANDKIIEMLRHTETLIQFDHLEHSYPHCWRHKIPMIFRATPQWFIAMDNNDLREALLREINQVEWRPQWGKARISAMVENRPDWCISRQRAWGTPMPLFIHKKTGELHPKTAELIEEVAKRIEEKGIDAWFALRPEELLAEDAEHYEKVDDTMDVWLDSGVSHYAVLKRHPELRFPADIYFEGSDQHRGWFNSSLTTSVAMYGTTPYTRVLTHGYTVDAEGKKLSKSSGNYVSLDKLINQYGADILRLWVASTDYQHEASISEEIIKRNADAYRRIRNTARFLLANLFDFIPEENSVRGEHLVELDQWAIARCRQLQKEIEQAYDEYQFHVIYQKIHNFCAIDMGGFYLDIIKDRQYTCAKDSRARRSCQTAMYHIIHALTRWLAPILSYTADEIWQHIPGQHSESVFVEQWYENWPPSLPEVDMESWEQLYIAREEVNKALEEKRQSEDLGSALAAEITIYADDQTLPLLTRLGDELRFLMLTSEARVLPLNDKPEDLDYADEKGMAIRVVASSQKKCARCWQRRKSIGQDAEHPELCLRCAGNIGEQEEVRQYA